MAIGITERVSLDAPIVVLGCGIIGLTTAIRLIESQLNPNKNVHILADHLPSDVLSAYYASTAAGAHHLSFADDGDERQRKWDRRTFEVMLTEWRMLGEQSGLMKITQTEYYDGDEKHLAILEEHPDFVIHPTSELPSFATHSVSFTSLTMNPAPYLSRLVADFLTLGGKIHRLHVPSLHSLSSPQVLALLDGRVPSKVIVCAGIGALTLGGVEDQTVFPVRGQVIRVHAPWVRTGWTRQIGKLAGGEGGERTYVIPRENGDVIVGGTREVDDWLPTPREETTSSIISRAIEICPSLVPPHLQQTSNPTESSLETTATPLVSEGSILNPLKQNVIVGFRPSRVEGIRLERGPDIILPRPRSASKSNANMNAEDEGEESKWKMKVFYNYGHGGAGWQSSWGTAEDIVDLALAD
ncbi:d-aspartate oxidase [Phaffia rhodozyma]|uniref:D-aspartate oxidase n=1 Tax=Phaffia rhodozyma TaxID=264483 RepID=A0A0F7SQ35_PHARH|nr:d-aspartate oxidase [Phaffia rhodozyma]